MKCRVCSGGIFKVADLGSTPLADKFPLTADQEETEYPLGVSYCEDCNSLQASDKLDMYDVFDDDYGFFTGASPSGVKYFEEYAEELKELFPEQSKGFVLEIASNDGTMLQSFKDSKNVMGVDACKNVCIYASEQGINTVCGFWGDPLASVIERGHGKADLIIANNVLAHVEDPNDFISGVYRQLSDNGVFVFEFQYAIDLAGQMVWDNIYHEHRSFFSKRAIDNLLENHMLQAVMYKHTSPHGGSLRVVATKNLKQVTIPNGYEKWDTLEFAIPALIGNMQSRIMYNSDALIDMVDRLKAEGKTIAGYGASAKSCTLLNVTGIELDYIVDLTPHKVGRFAPGTKIPIISPEYELAHHGRADVYLLTVWNYAEAILKREREYMAKGGRFILPIPYPVLV